MAAPEEPSVDADVDEAEASIDVGTYELLRGRLETSARRLTERAAALNADRLEHFGSSRFEPIGSERIRTENSCVPRDLAAAGPYLVFGYNVFLGLRSETSVADVLSLHRFERHGDEVRFEEVGHDVVPGLLDDARFVEHFGELYTYYKQARLLGLHRSPTKLLAVFQTGETLDDLRVFRWEVRPDGTVAYIDNRGERDHAPPPSHELAWTATTRDDHVRGRTPHVNVVDTLFVQTADGQLTVRIENNTAEGEVVFREPVAEATQSLVDTRIEYAASGSLLLVRILPYKEETWRHLVFNRRTRRVERIDAIGLACRLLPEDQGIIFPGGYHLDAGETRTFDLDLSRMAYVETRRSPNGEDVLYVFGDERDGRSILLSYNVIRKEVAPPITCHGYSVFDDGTVVVFSADDEPSRLHRLQVWATPYASEDHAAGQPVGASFLDTIGNPDLVRAISDAYALVHLVEAQEPSTAGYERLLAEADRITDAYFWLGAPEAHRVLEPVQELRRTGELVLAEFERTQSLRDQAAAAVAHAAKAAAESARQRALSPPGTAEAHVAALADLRHQQGHLLSLRELRYVDLEALDALGAEIDEALEAQAEATVAHLSDAASFAPFHDRLAELEAEVGAAPTVVDLDAVGARLDEITVGLELLTEVVGGLAVRDATVRTTILEQISEVLGGANRVRAMLEGRRDTLRRAEDVAAFGAEFLVLGQAVQSALAMADTAASCDDQLTRLLAQLEGLETRFGDTAEFAEQLATRRDELYEAFGARKQALLDQHQRRVDRLSSTAERVLDTVRRRAGGFTELDGLNAFFAGDLTVARIRDLTAELRGIGEAVRADELDAALAAVREEAGRFQRDRADLYEDGDAVIRLGHHRFSVSSQALEPTLVPAGDRMELLLGGTDLRLAVHDEALEATRDRWDQVLVSEHDNVYRSEYLAYTMLLAAERGLDGASLAELHGAELSPESLTAHVRAAAERRYDEGYERGVHDHDAALVLDALLRLRDTAGLLRFPGRARALGWLWWVHGAGREPLVAGTSADDAERSRWVRRCGAIADVQATFGASAAADEVAADLAEELRRFSADHRLGLDDAADAAGSYLVEELGTGGGEVSATVASVDLRDGLLRHLDRSNRRRQVVDALADATVPLAERHQVGEAWVAGHLGQLDETDRSRLTSAADEAVALLLLEGSAVRAAGSARLDAVTVRGLLGRHPRIVDGALEVRLDEVLDRLGRFERDVVPSFRAYQRERQRVLATERARLGIDQLVPRPQATFVRNHLIDQVYLPLLGDNLAKQLGTVEGGGADRSGVLLVISPPGYGKTMLMEYVAGRLGMAMVKVNGPALGHGVTSVDPAAAPDATSAAEVAKINLALEMGNNVMLYLDDIQHVHPELLQRFIPMGDTTRRMEGVWEGRPRTYDLRGKRFCVVMAGNPYTESGERFRIPDMLANRADTYNLGEVLGGHEDLFELSYLENALTANPVTAPLAGRPAGDVVTLVRMARGEQVSTDQLEHPYGRAELDQVLAVLRHLVHLQGVVLAVNRAYIASAAQADADRTEPPFRLQGSYRNMVKLAQKVVPVMEPAEVETLLDDHYAGEAQTLTSGAEQSLLKLASLRGTLTEDQAQRWEAICAGYRRRAALGGDDDPLEKVVLQLSRLAEGIEGIEGLRQIRRTDGG